MSSPMRMLKMISAQLRRLGRYTRWSAPSPALAAAWATGPGSGWLGVSVVTGGLLAKTLAAA
jgi:hypothetical protein